ncbi:MAG: bacillithiol biosynthesis deacetylase BshB1 [Flavobacteriia bacterium]|nr:bacillithiol biosynthesis deacetylase BshB1 [Flavobacteriia bacterium]
MTDILAFGAHPDDIELGCGGTLAKATQAGKKVVAIDLTQGELGTRGSAELRLEEAAKAAKILGLQARENMGFKDGFFQNDEAHQRALIQKIRSYRPDVVLCNAETDRHIDHGKGSDLVHTACFLSGLAKIETIDSSGKTHKPWRPPDEQTPISSKNFIESVRYRAENLGRLIGSEAGEGFTSRQPLGVDSVLDWF